VEDYATDEERIEALKKWWKENGKSLIAGVALGLSVLFGWQAWVAGKNTEADSASNGYASLMANIERGQTEEAQKLSAEIVGQFSGSPYAVLSAMAVARLKVEQKDLLGAKTQLQWAMDHASLEEMKQLIRLRLARVLFALDDSDAALATLSGVDAGEFLAAYEELMGDIYLKQGDSKQAYESYRSSLGRMGLSSRNRTILQLKLDDMAGIEQGQEEAS
jgi:predicted negative regulator of RcsB-dependent stress response